MNDEPIYKENGRRDFWEEFQRGTDRLRLQIAIEEQRQSKIAYGIAAFCFLLILLLTAGK